MPGSVVNTATAAPVNGSPTDTGTAFVAMIAEQGPLVPTLLTSLAQAQSVYGADTAATIAATCLEAYFRLGGQRLWFNRLVGPAALAASITLNATGAVASTKFTANTVGTWGNNLRLAVIAPLVSGVRLQLSATTGPLATTPLTSPDLADKPAVLAYTGFTAYGTLSSAGAGLLPVVIAAANLTLGTDDNASITDPIRTTALAAFTRQMGPGQLMLPGNTTAGAMSVLGAAAAASGQRVGLWDGVDDPSAAVVAAAALAMRTDANSARVMCYEPWAQVAPSVPGGVNRDLPYSIVQAAIIARQDALTGNPNRPAAGDNGIAGNWVIGLKRTRTDTERDVTLTPAGVNVAVDLYANGTIRTYGNRTLTDPTLNALYLQASNVRLDMWLYAQLKAVADRFVFGLIDGKGKLAARYNAALVAVLKNLPDGALYALLDANNNEIDPGYVVNTTTGPGGPNTPATIAAGQLIAVVAYRRSPGAELVTLTLVTTPTTQGF